MLRAIAVSAAVVLSALSIVWPKAATVATILLLYVTFEYLLVTRDNLALTQEHLDLFQRQQQRQERVELHFDLVCSDMTVILRVSNLGFSNFLLQRAQVRRPDASNFGYDVHRIVESGKTDEVLLPTDLFKGMTFGGDLEITLAYLGLDGSGKTLPKCFNVFLGMQSAPVEVTEGLDDATDWAVNCPKCKVPVLTNVHGLKTFDAAVARKSQLAADLAASCPEHKSEFLLTQDAVKEQQREHSNRLEI